MNLIDIYRTFYSKSIRIYNFLKCTQNILKERPYAKIKQVSINLRRLKSYQVSFPMTMVWKYKSTTKRELEKSQIGGDQQYATENQLVQGRNQRK